MGLTQITTGGVDDNINIDSNTLKVDGTNNRVGIGTAAPSNILSLNDTEASGGVGIDITNQGDGGSSTTPYVFINAKLNPSRNGGEIRFGREDVYGSQSTADSFMAFYTAVNDTNTERLRIDSSGNIGIGTDNPGTLVDLKGTNARLRLRPAADTQVTDIAFGNAAGSSTRGLIRYDHNSEFMFFETNASERMRIDSLGNVGIGNSNPTNSAGYNTLTLGNGTSTGGQIHLENSSGADFYLWHDGSGVNIYNQGASSQKFYTNASERMRIDSSGNLLVGTTTASGKMTVKMDTNKNISFSGTQGEVGGVPAFVAHQDAGSLAEIGMRGVDIRFATGSSERMRIDSSGRLLVNKTGSPSAGEGSQAPVFIQGKIGSTNNPGILALARGQSGVEMANGASLGVVTFTDDSGDDYAQIKGAVDGSSSSTDHPGRLTFLTTPDGSSSPTERMRLDQDGSLNLGCTANPTVNSAGPLHILAANGKDAINIKSEHTGNVINVWKTNTGALLSFYQGSSQGSVKGSITISTTNVAFNTSSDYRLKENVVALDGAITRVKQLQPKRFNFIVDADTTVDGFLAHEAQAVVPEAVTGTHNEVDDDGNAVMQGIDQSKLVPLLTAALQEAIAKIETLETQNADLLARVTALEAG